MIRRIIYLIMILAALPALAGCGLPHGRGMILSSGDSLAMELYGDPALASRWGRKLADRYFMEGSVLQMQQRYADALAQYEHVLRLAPQRGAAHFAIARCYQALGKYDTALAHAQKALAIDSGNIDARLQVADLLMANGRVPRAVEQYEQILLRQPNNIIARYNAARLQQRMNPERAILHYEYIRRNLGEDYNALLDLAEIYLTRREYDEAADIVRELIVLDPANVDLYRLLSDSYIRGERFAEAAALIYEVEKHITPDSVLHEYLVEELTVAAHSVQPESPDDLRQYMETVSRRSLELMPKRWEPVFYSGLIRYHLGDSLHADSLLAAALAHREIPISAWTEAATLYIDDGLSPRALRLMLPTYNRHRDDYRVPYLVGFAYFQMSRHDSAEKYFRRSLAIDEENSEAWGHLALIYSRQGKVATSQAAYEKAIMYDPENQSLLNNYAYSLAEHDRQLDRALELVDRALEVEPENESFLDTKGWIYYKMKDYERALQYIQRSVDIGGASSEVMEHLGDVQRALGNIPAAREAYDRGMRLNPNDTELRKKLEELMSAPRPE